MASFFPRGDIREFAYTGLTPTHENGRLDVVLQYLNRSVEVPELRGFAKAVRCVFTVACERPTHDPDMCPRTTHSPLDRVTNVTVIRPAACEVRTSAPRAPTEN
jgi:hypothetical protein